MDLSLLAVHFTDISWVLLALAFGMVASFVSLPPMVGYLAAGFVLSSAGMEIGDTLRAVADIGVTLLLFSIGLKLNVRDLLRREIWGVASLHVMLTIISFSAMIMGLGILGVQYLSGLSLFETALIAFALSFSSTVFAVKVLEEKGEMYSLHGKIAIGILIMQDLFAVVFIAAATGKAPSIWAVLLVLLIPLRPLLMKLVVMARSDELLILAGIALALGGATLFEAVGVKADLGALAFGVLLSGCKRSGELLRALLAFKEVFLVAFFLSIGFNGVPDTTAILIALVLALLMFGKSLLFFLLLVAFRLRVRTGFLASLALSNYSEFGLIVGAMAVSAGWMDSQWLVIIAIALSLTFIMASVANSYAHQLYARLEERLSRFERIERLDDDRPIDVGEAKVLIFGMGRVGSGVYDTLKEKYGDRLLGIDSDREVVKKQLEAGRHVIIGDATDYDFWERLKPGSVELIMLDMPNEKELLDAVKIIKSAGYQGRIAAAVKNKESLEMLKQAGVDSVFNIYAEAGSGFANHTTEAGRA